MTDMKVAKTILEQLGGSRFIAMTGARNLTGDANSLTLKVPHAAKKITHLRVKLDPSDTYSVEFLNCRITKNGLKQEVVENHSDVYAEDLQPLFTEVTGLYTHL